MVDKQLVISGLTELAEECLTELGSKNSAIRERASTKCEHVLEIMNLLEYFPADKAEETDERYEAIKGETRT